SFVEFHSLSVPSPRVIVECEMSKVGGIELMPIEPDLASIGSFIENRDGVRVTELSQSVDEFLSPEIFIVRRIACFLGALCKGRQCACVEPATHLAHQCRRESEKLARLCGPQDQVNFALPQFGFLRRVRTQDQVLTVPSSLCFTLLRTDSLDH